MLINVKMPTIVGIVTFISMINTTLNSLKAREVFIIQHFSFYEQLKFHASSGFIILGPKMQDVFSQMSDDLNCQPIEFICYLLKLSLYRHCKLIRKTEK